MESTSPTARLVARKRTMRFMAAKGRLPSESGGPILRQRPALEDLALEGLHAAHAVHGVGDGAVVGAGEVELHRADYGGAHGRRIERRAERRAGRAEELSRAG